MGLFGRLFGPKGDCSLEEAAELIGTSPETVRRLTEDGELKSASTPCGSTNRQWMISTAEPRNSMRRCGNSTGQARN